MPEAQAQQPVRVEARPVGKVEQAKAAVKKLSQEGKKWFKDKWEKVTGKEPSEVRQVLNDVVEADKTVLLIDEIEKHVQKVEGTPEEQVLKNATFQQVEKLKGDGYGEGVVWKMSQSEDPTQFAVFKPSDKQRNLEYQWGPEIWIKGETIPRREVAAYIVSKELGFDCVPPTVYRTDIEAGGSLQKWVDGETGDKFDLTQIDSSRLTAIATFNHLIGSIDGHKRNIMRQKDGQVVLIDNGLTFPSMEKGFYNNFEINLLCKDQSIPEKILTKLKSFITDEGKLTSEGELLSKKLSDHINSEEINYFFLRLKNICKLGIIPNPLDK